MIKESEHCSKVIETQFDITLVTCKKKKEKRNKILIILPNVEFVEKHMKKVK